MSIRTKRIVVAHDTLPLKAQKRQPPIEESWRNIAHRHDYGWWSGTIVPVCLQSGLRQQTGFFWCVTPIKNHSYLHKQQLWSDSAWNRPDELPFFITRPGKGINQHNRTKSPERWCCTVLSVRTIQYYWGDAITTRHPPAAKALKGKKVNTIASVKRALTRRVRFENRCFMGCSFLW